MNTFNAIAQSDQVLDSIESAPATYAEQLTALALAGYADKLPLDVKGKPTADVAKVIADIHEAYQSAGVSGIKALRNRTLRLKYAVHILAANPKRDEETEENYVKRCLKIRSMANAGDRDQIDKAIKGSTAKVKRTARPIEPKAKPAKVTPELIAEPAPKPADVNDALTVAHNELVKAMSAYADAVDAYRKAGKTMTKASVSTITTRAHNLVSLLAG
jgi:hypothetical protein